MWWRLWLRCTFGVVIGFLIASCLAYLVTDVAPFSGDLVTDDFRPVPRIGAFLVPLFGERVGAIPDVMLSTLMGRIFLIPLFALVLALGFWRWRRWWVAGLELGIVALALELLLAVPASHSWLGMLMASVSNWSNPPAHLMPRTLIIRTAAAYCIPPVATAMGVALWFGWRDRQRFGKV